MDVSNVSKQLWVGDKSLDRPKNLLFCHHAGGAPLNYSRHFGNHKLLVDYNVLALCIPGRPNLKIPLAQRLEILCESMESTFNAHEGVSLVGNSMGALWAYVLAFELGKRQKIKVKNLFVASMAAGSVGLDSLKKLAESDDETLFQHSQALGGVSADASSKQFFLSFLPLLRHDLNWLEESRGWMPAKVACPIHVLWGDKDVYLNSAGRMAWNNCSTLVKEQAFAGQHFFMFERSNEVVNYIRQWDS